MVCWGNKDVKVFAATDYRPVTYERMGRPRSVVRRRSEVPIRSRGAGSNWVEFSSSEMSGSAFCPIRIPVGQCT